jgi:hypothetical protein
MTITVKGEVWEANLPCNLSVGSYGTAIFKCASDPDKNFSCIWKASADERRAARTAILNHKEEVDYMDKYNDWGGNRPGAGRKPSGKKARQIYVTDEEYQKIKDFINTLRGE